MVSRRRRVGAEIVDGGVHFRVWAPERQSVAVVFDDSAREQSLNREDGGYFAGRIADIGAGTRYRFRLDDDRDALPDPASRFQPEGPHGSSQVVDPSTFKWSDASWRGIDRNRHVMSEIHVGTFTPEGTYEAAIEKLPLLADVGIDVIEMMPIHEFPGEFGWGYDGVDLWAPSHLYGQPDDLRRFIDAAHRLRIAVILDVVYNHFGPDGCYLARFSKSYFTKKYENEWGEAVNFDGACAAAVREFVRENAAYWIDEFHFDGLRLDATQSLFDDSPRHIVAEINAAAREAGGSRSLFIVAENEPQHTRLVREYGVDALWNDDWHHAAMVALTGRNEAYYTDYAGAAYEFVAMAESGFLYQGQWYSWQEDHRGTRSSDLPSGRFVKFLQNHDQIANSADGLRIHDLADPGDVRAMTALLLLGPQTPLLFQGQEFAASQPFLYFADHKPELAALVEKGRREFLTQFPSLAGEEVQRRLALPNDRATFERCKIDWRDRERNAHAVALHRDLIRLRSSLPDTRVTGTVLGLRTFRLQWAEEYALLINLSSEPAPSFTSDWKVIWSTEAPEYGGSGQAGHAATLFQRRR